MLIALEKKKAALFQHFNNHADFYQYKHYPIAYLCGW